MEFCSNRNLYPDYKWVFSPHFSIGMGKLISFIYRLSMLQYPAQSAICHFIRFLQINAVLFQVLNSYSTAHFNMFKLVSSLLNVTPAKHVTHSFLEKRCSVHDVIVFYSINHIHFLNELIHSACRHSLTLVVKSIITLGLIINLD